MNRLSTADRTRVIWALVEGNSLRATARMTGVARMTVEKLLRDLGAACAEYHDSHIRNITARRIECDEIWAFVGAKSRNATLEQKAQGWGDCWTWTAIDPQTKLIVSYAVGARSQRMAHTFMQDVASRLANRVQMTTDGLGWYLDAVDDAFGSAIDYATLVKHYGTGATDTSASLRYSPPRFISAQRKMIQGRPNPRHVSTSMVERQNLTMRMHMRRFTRLTNGFSKKVENHIHSIALHFMYYNFCKIHQTLRVTPAMEAGLSSHVWAIDELISLLDVSSSEIATA